MAGKPIEIPISVDADGAEKGVEKIADAFEEVEDSLKDLNKAGDKAEDALKDLGKTGEKAFESVADSADDAGQKIDRDLTKALEEVDNKIDSTGKSGKNIGDGISEGSSRASESLTELREEADSTATEAAASFDGSAESIAGAFQELAANTFGPIGLAAAIGIGIAITKMQELAEVNNEAKESMAELAHEIYLTGGELDDAAIAEKIEEIAFALKNEDNPWTPWANEAETGIGAVKKALEGVKDVDVKSAFKGLAGDVEAGQKAFDELSKSIEEDNKVLAENVEYTMDGMPVYTAEQQVLKDSVDARVRLRDEISKATGASKEATAEAGFYKDVMGETSDAVEERREAEEDLKDAQEERTEATLRQQEADLETITTNLDVLDSLDDLAGKLKENGYTLEDNTKKGRDNIRAVIDSATAIRDNAQAQLDAGGNVEAVTGKFQEQRNVLINQVLPAFNGNREAAERYVDSLLKTPPAVKTVVQLDKTDAEQKLYDLQRHRTIPVTIQPDGTQMDKYIWSQQGRKIFVDVAPRGGGQALALP